MLISFLSTIAIHPAKEAKMTLLVFKKVQILSKYLDFLDIFLEKKALVILAAINLN